MSELWNEDEWGDDSAFFDKVHSDVQQQLVKEEHQVSTKRKPRAVAEVDSYPMLNQNGLLCIPYTDCQ